MNLKNIKIKKTKIGIFLLIIIILIVIIFIKISHYAAKNLKIGNNTTSQEIIENILNISSYQAEIEVTIKSNKNENKYKIKQTYIENEESTQEILEPDNIDGVKITKKGNILEVENTKLNLKNIIENYNEIASNNLDLSSFLNDYKDNENSRFREENEQLVMETTAKTDNKYQKYEYLYISRNTGKPEKMIIMDTNKNTTIYIIYNEININDKNNKRAYAFEIYDEKIEI